MPTSNSRHAAVGSWFLGPRAENFEYMEKLFKKVLDGQKDARVNLYAQDAEFITDEMQADEMFQESMQTLELELETISTVLAKHSVPFWSPRYNAHMNMDVSLPSIIGYMTAMMYNPNNCATEASPFTTLIEKRVGLQLCQMLGYNVDPNSEEPMGWGHITSGGTVANFEAIWCARNIKFYPFSFKLAIEQGMLSFLANVKPPFEITLCNGVKKPFVKASVWELLNLRAKDIMDIPSRLFTLYGISQTFLNKAMTPYLVQTVGKDYIENYFKIDKPTQLFVGTTKHYSWPKGGALVGIGSENVVDVPVDDYARMDVNALRQMLEDCIDSDYESEKRAIYAVVAIIGSTESGAVDPLKDILALRTEYEAKGLSFLVHCDAAWGGYFASMLRENPGKPVDMTPDRESYFVPSMTLLPYTKTQLEYFGYADSITIDPHKSGYIPYPNGALCYRDERMRYQVTFTSPIVYRAGDELESIGVYGVEGSKPGAAPVSAYLSHQVIGLHKDGHGALLGEATFSCTKLYSHWVTMTRPDSDLIVVPLNRLPEEEVENPDPAKIEAQRKFIRERICNKTNAEIANDPEAIALMADLGGDSMINAFACNFKINGKVNEDIVEANYLNTRIFNRLSITKMEDDVETRPLILTSTSFSQKAYGNCLTKFKERLGLKGEQDLYVLVNVTMSPFPTVNNFIQNIADDFERVANEELKKCVPRNSTVPDHHGFIMHGTDKVYFVHLPMFNMENHRYQLIFTGDLPADILAKYRAVKFANPDQYYTLGNIHPSTLEEMLKPGATWDARINFGIPQDDIPDVANGFKISNIRVVVKDSLHTNNLDTVYPEQMPFHLYGTREQQHIDHILRCTPNIMLSSDRVKLNLRKRLTERELASGLCAVLTDVREVALQPLGDYKSEEHKKLIWNGFSFHPGDHFQVSIYRSYADYKARVTPISSGELTLGTSVFVDAKEINHDPAMHHAAAPAEPIPGEHDGHEATTQPIGPALGIDIDIIVPGERAGFERGAANRRALAQDWELGWERTRAEIARKLGLDDTNLLPFGPPGGRQGHVPPGPPGIGPPSPHPGYSRAGSTPGTPGFGFNLGLGSMLGGNSTPGMMSPSPSGPRKKGFGVGLDFNLGLGNGNVKQ